VIVKIFLSTFLLLIPAAIIVGVIVRHFSSPICPHCAKRHAGCEHSSYRWARGYNWLCKQAIGDGGWYCATHRKVFYDRSSEDFLVTLSVWCTDEHGNQGRMDAEKYPEQAAAWKLIINQEKT